MKRRTFTYLFGFLPFVRAKKVQPEKEKLVAVTWESVQDGHSVIPIETIERHIKGDDWEKLMQSMCEKLDRMAIEALQEMPQQ